MEKVSIVAKKRGRKTKDEYYQTKKIDNVSSQDNSLHIYLPISLDECFHDPVIDMQLEIMASTPKLDSYVPENTQVYSEVVVLEKKPILCSSTSPVYNEDITSNNVNINKDLYDISLVDISTNTHNSRTSISCWWCCHTFQEQPIHMPVSYRREIFKVFGIFCSYPCCYSYMISCYKYKKNIYMLNHMFKLQTKNNGVMLDYFKPAPPRESLTLFGGPLNISEFRQPDCLFVMNMYPMVYIPSQLEKIKIDTVPKKFFKILPPSKKFNTPTIKLQNNSLGKILGICLPRLE